MISCKFLFQIKRETHKPEVAPINAFQIIDRYKFKMFPNTMRLSTQDVVHEKGQNRKSLTLIVPSAYNLPKI